MIHAEDLYRAYELELSWLEERDNVPWGRIPLREQIAWRWAADVANTAHVQKAQASDFPNEYVQLPRSDKDRTAFGEEP